MIIAALNLEMEERASHFRLRSLAHANDKRKTQNADWLLARRLPGFKTGRRAPRSAYALDLALLRCHNTCDRRSFGPTRGT